eukprot:136648-Ditylum_brightwellii.AAC.1
MSARSKTSVKDKPPGEDKNKICILCQQLGGNPNYRTAKDCYRCKVIMPSKMQAPCKCPACSYRSMEDLYASNLKLAKKL